MEILNCENHLMHSSVWFFFSYEGWVVSFQQDSSVSENSFFLNVVEVIYQKRAK